MQQLHADQDAVLWKAQRFAIREAPQRDVFRRARCISQTAGASIEAGPHHEAECSPEGVGRPKQGAEIGRLGHTLDADAEIAA